METLAVDYPVLLTETHEPPCLSIYLPTHRHAPDNQQDPIRLKNLLRQVEKSLLETMSRAAVGDLLAPLEALLDDKAFWNHSLDGLALLRSADSLRVYKLRIPVSELVMIDDDFYTKPLVRALQSAGSYHVLAVDMKKIRLYEGDKHSIAEVELGDESPKTIQDALGDELSDPFHTSGAYGKGAGTAMFHGHGGRKDEVEIDAERFFRVVDKWVTEHISAPSEVPLIIAMLPEHQSLFRAVSKNPKLVAEGIEIDPFALSADELRDRAWEIIDRYRDIELSVLAEKFGNEQAQGRASSDLAELGRAAVEGRVEVLMIEEGRRIPGTIDSATGAVTYGDDPTGPDLLDEIGEIVLRASGGVAVVPIAQMPSDTGAAGLLRY